MMGLANAGGAPRDGGNSPSGMPAHRVRPADDGDAQRDRARRPSASQEARRHDRRRRRIEEAIVEG